MFGNPSRNMLTLLFLEHSAESLYLQLGSKCRELKDIHFGQCYKISDEGMIVIAKGCLKLQRIYMQENKLILDWHFIVLLCSTLFSSSWILPNFTCTASISSCRADNIPRDPGLTGQAANHAQGQTWPYILILIFFCISKYRYSFYLLKSKTQ